jgi:virginiamycin B lyase
MCILPHNGQIMMLCPTIGATQSIINGNDGYVWAADFFNKKAVRLETRGSTNLANFSINNGGTAPAFMTVGPNDADGKTLWITSRDQKIATKFSIFRQTGTVYPLTDNPAYMDASAPAIAKGSDGNLWFTEPFYDKGKIGKMTPTGEVTHYDLPPYSNPEAITAGPDGNIWFLDAVHPGGTTESFVSKVGKIAPSGTITEYTLPAGYTVGGSITAGPDGNIWFMGLDMVGKITTTGNPTKYDLPTGSAQVISASIAAGPDGNLWFTEQKGVGRITPTGTITHFPITTFSNAGTPAGITAGPDGNMWFSNVIYNVGPVGSVIARVILNCPTSYPASSGAASSNPGTSSSGNGSSGNGSSGNTSSTVSAPSCDACKTICAESAENVFRAMSRFPSTRKAGL